MSPIEVKDLQRYLPHRPPMVWMDRILWTEPTSGQGSLTLDATAPYWGEHGVLQCAPIEWMAQAAAFSAASRWRENENQQPLKDAFLVGIKDAWLCDLSALKPGMIVTVTVRIVKELSPLTLVAGEVQLGDQTIAKATLKLFGQ